MIEEFPKNKLRSSRKAKKTSSAIPATFWQRWSERQNRIYVQFLKINEQSFSTQWKRRSTKIFLQMSKAIGTRNINQCKSHHQKMISHYYTLQKIRENLKKTEISEPFEKNSLGNGLETTKQQLKTNVNMQKKSGIQIMEMQSQFCESIFGAQLAKEDYFILTEKGENQYFDRHLFHCFSFQKQQQNIIKTVEEPFQESSSDIKLKNEINSINTSSNLCENCFDVVFNVLDLKN